MYKVNVYRTHVVEKVDGVSILSMIVVYDDVYDRVKQYPQVFANTQIYSRSSSVLPYHLDCLHNSDHVRLFDIVVEPGTTGIFIARKLTA